MSVIQMVTPEKRVMLNLNCGKVVEGSLMAWTGNQSRLRGRVLDDICKRISALDPDPVKAYEKFVQLTEVTFKGG